MNQLAAAAPAVAPPAALAEGRTPRLLRLALVLATGLCLALASRGDHPGATVAIMLTVGIAAVVSSTVGFAHSALAGVVVYRVAETPLEAVTILMACSLTIQAYSVLHLWRAIEWRRVAPFAASGLVTLVPGCWLALHAPVHAYLAGLGLFLGAYGVYMLVRRSGPGATRGDGFHPGDLLAGALGGLTGPLAAFPSLPVTIWLGRRGWDKLRQRAVYQPFIVVMQLAGLLVLAAMGSTRPLAWDRLAYAVPSLLGCSVGLDLFRRLSTARFNALVHLLVAVSGVALALK